MDLLAAVKREERKIEIQLARLRHQLSRVRAASKVLSKSASRDFAQGTKRVMSATARAKISKAAKKRWAKIRTRAKKVAG